MTPPPPAPFPYVLTTAQMRAVDRAVMERTGLPSLILMENAGRGIAETIVRHLAARSPSPSPAALSIAVVCGAGSNGGDGLVVARRLVARGGAPAVRPRVLLTAAPAAMKSDAAVMLRALRDLSNVEVSDLSAASGRAAWDQALAGADVIVDAIFGTGLREDVEGNAAAAIAAINAAGAFRVAVDIPSGLDGDSGRPRGVSVRAHLTVTVGARKVGLVVDPDAGAGAVEVVDLGVPLAVDGGLGPFCFWIEEDAVRAALPARAGGAHKGTGGHLIVVAGSAGKTGAALLTGRAGLRAGAGLVTVASTAAGCAALDAKVVEIMTVPFCEGDDAAADGFDRIAALAKAGSVRALAVGPGIPRGPGMRDVVRRLACELPQAMVLDADALNLLGEDAARILATAVGPRVITPHPGEMGRLSGRSTAAVQGARVDTARAFAAASRAVVVLKGARTLVAAPDGTVFVNPTVEPALATAGSGDVLAGVVASLLSQGMEPLAAARAAVFLHGCAGTRAATVYGPTGVVAGDLPDAIAAVRALWASAPSADHRW